MRIIIEFDVSSITINFACTYFWSPYLVQIGAEIRVSIADVDLDRYSPSIGLLVRLFVVEAGWKPFFPPRTKKDEQGLKNMDGLAWSP